MIYYPKLLDYNGFNVSCKWLELTLHWKIGYFEGQNDENLPEDPSDICLSSHGRSEHDYIPRIEYTVRSFDAWKKANGIT
jgi:hypothetical protein